MTLANAELVERARRGDHAAFEQLAAASIDRLYAIAARVLREQAAAEDAVQEALLSAWRDIRALRDSSRWDAWLYRLLLNSCRDEQRRRWRRPVSVGPASRELASIGDEMGAVERRDELERGLRRLTVDHRMALTLHFYLDMRPREIADLLGIPEGTATSRIHYGSRALRAALEPEARTTANSGAAK
jgi:RNA polymerase sigma-70 factor, ECF subfamily